MRRLTILCFLGILLALFANSCKEKNYGAMAAFKPVIRFSEAADTLCFSTDRQAIYFDSRKYRKNIQKSLENKMRPNQENREEKNKDTVTLWQGPVNYEINYVEYRAVKDNLLELALANEELIRHKIDYVPMKGYYQKLYFKDLNFTYNHLPAYTYHSLKFNAYGEVVHIGHSYMGLLDKCYSYDGKKFYWRVTFSYDLIYKKESKFLHRQAHYSVKRRSKKDGDMVFYIDPFKDDSLKPGRDSLYVNTIIVNGNNKIGGPKPLVYPVKNIMGHADALKFKRPQKPIKKI